MPIAPIASAQLPFPVPIEINLQIVSYLSPQKQAQFRRVSRVAKEIIRWSVLEPKFRGAFNSLEKLELFFDDAKQYTGRSKKTLLVLLEKLLRGYGYPDGEFDQILREAGILPNKLSLTIVQRHWLKLLPNLVGVLRWVPAEEMGRIIGLASPLAERLKNVLLALGYWGQSAKLPLAMLKDDTGIDLGITADCGYLRYVAGFEGEGPNNQQQRLNLALGVEIATILLERGVNIEAHNTYTTQTALHIASRNGYSKLVELLISQGANIEARDRLKRTPLRVAAESGKAEVIECLLKAGATPNISPPPHPFYLYITDTPLDIARRYHCVDIIKLLEKAGGLSRKDHEAEQEAQALLHRRALSNKLSLIG